MNARWESETAARLRDFAATRHTTFKAADEKGQAQLFLDRLFQAFGHAGALEAGATYEKRVRSPAEGRSVSFADLDWRPRVIFEMKRGGVRLDRHYDQAMRYWQLLRPPQADYVVLCNFDEFHVFDTANSIIKPADVIPIDALADRWQALGFLAVEPAEPVFNFDREKATREAARELGKFFLALVGRGVAEDAVQRFVLQSLLAMFAEDVGLLPDLLFTRLLNDCIDGKIDAYDALWNGLFQQMNSKGRTPAGRFKGTPYFNGGILERLIPFDLLEDDLATLRRLSSLEWSGIEPAIFGTLFEASTDPEKRRTEGKHFTSETDIMSIVRPVIVEPWLTRIDQASRSSAKVAELQRVLDEMHSFRVLDPACGSGNFLAVAFRELRRLEMIVLDRLREVGQAKRHQTMQLTRVSLHQFFGIEKDDFSAELAKVALALTKQMVILDEDAAYADEPLPIDDLDDNILAEDALFIEWPEWDACIGNPPYLGAKYQEKRFGKPYADRVKARFPDVNRMADFVTHWFRLAQDTAKPGARVGLVATKSVRESHNRVASLDYVVDHGGQIYEAIGTEPWGGDANVIVSIVCWRNGDPERPRKLLESGDAAWLELDEIPTSLRGGTFAGKAKSLRSSKAFVGPTYGVIPRYEGYLISHELADQWIARDPRNARVLRPFLIGRDLYSKECGPSRMCIDFTGLDVTEAAGYREPFAHLRATVVPDLEDEIAARLSLEGQPQLKRFQRHLSRWWEFHEPVVGLRALVAGQGRYLATSNTSVRNIWDVISADVVPSNTLTVFPTGDLAVFAVLQSTVHWAWWKAVGSYNNGRPRFNTKVRDSFPWACVDFTGHRIELEKAAQALLDFRESRLDPGSFGLKDLHRTLELPGGNPLKERIAALDLLPTEVVDTA